MRLLAALLGLLVVLPAAAQPQPSHGCRIACRIGQGAPSPDQQQCLAQCVAGQAQPSDPQSVSPAATAPPPQPQAAPARTATSPPALAAAPSATPPAIHGAFYLGTLPSMSYGIAVAQPDRFLAHRLAESSCRGRSGTCALQKEFSDTCATLVEGVRRAASALFITSDPRTYVVRAISLGTADNPADAERMAREECALRERGGLTCRVVHAECGAR